MNQTQDLEVLRNLFSFSAIKEVKETLFRISKDNKIKVAAIELPINNYLKTPEEIEEEFQYGTNVRKANFLQERKDSLNYGVSISKTDGYLNIHNLDEALSGFM